MQALSTPPLSLKQTLMKQKDSDKASLCCLQSLKTGSQYEESKSDNLCQLQHWIDCAAVSTSHVQRKSSTDLSSDLLQSVCPSTATPWNCWAQSQKRKRAPTDVDWVGSPSQPSPTSFRIAKRFCLASARNAKSLVRKVSSDTG